MDLILWRHADAFDAVPGQRDLDRALTPLGERQAQLIAQWLAPRLRIDTRIVVSPALRAQQTASALGRAFETLAAVGAGADPDTHLLHHAGQILCESTVCERRRCVVSRPADDRRR